MLGALKNLWNSEKAVAAGILSIASTVLVALGSMTVEQWTDFNKWVLTVYVAGKTITSGVDALATRRAQTAGEATTELATTEPAPITAAGEIKQ